jgi:hypothetical protein
MRELEQTFAPYTMLNNEMKQKEKQLPVTLFFFSFDLNALTNLIRNHFIDFSYFYFVSIYKKENIPLKSVEEMSH